MKKLLALILAAVLAIGMVACTTAPATDEPGTAPDADGSEEIDLSAQPAGSITLRVQMSLGQWTDNFDTLIESYMAEHPEIAAIEANFPSSDVGEELLLAALNAGELPDIIGMAYGYGMEQWWQYCVDLSSGCPAYDLLTEEQKTLGTCGDYGMIIMPIYVEGTGILYNMRLLEEAGWTTTPQTRDELLQLCKDLTDAGITP